MPALALVLAAAAFFVVQEKDARARMAEIETFEIEIGEPIGDAVARSTRKYDFRIPLDMQSLDIPGLEEKPGGLEIILRNGGGKSVAFPWQPRSGVLWMYVGVADEIGLHFSGFDGPPLGQGESPPDDPQAADIDGITDIYGKVMALVDRPRAVSHCYHNSLHLTKGPCERVIMATGRHGLDGQAPDGLATTLRAYHAEVASEDWEISKTRTPLVLNLGQWWFPNGNLAMLQVMPDFDFAAAVVDGKKPFRLKLRVNVKDHFNSSMARLMLNCYDQQAIFPEKITYSQAQAAQIFHGLYADFFPPVVDGVEVTDRITLAELDWGPLSDSYANDPAVRQHFCDLVQKLEREAGYDGPVAPRN